MSGVRAAPGSLRFAWGALFALLLALRLMGSSGYMPAAEHGRLTIIVCPDAELNASLGLAMAHHGKGHAKHDHNPCPYAAAGALGAVDPHSAPLLAIAVFAVALLLGRTFLFIERHSGRERPPSRAPPIPA